jgi:YVTN family beta-propeller protein
LRKVHTVLGIALGIASGSLASAAHPYLATDPRFTVATVPLPGEGRGDYLFIDAAARRLYVTHTGQVHVLDLDGLRPVGMIAGLKAAHGVAIDRASGHGFVTDGGQDAVVMFDLASARTLKTIPVGRKPDSILRDGASGKVLAFNRESNDVSVIDPVNGMVSGTVKLPAGPESAQSDDHGRIWVNLDDGNAIATIDARTMTLARVIPLPGCDGPAPLAFDRVAHLLFSGCGNQVMIVTDANSGRQLSRVKVGDDPDGIMFDPVRKRIFVGNRGGSWTVIAQRSRSSYVTQRPLRVQPYAKTMALDPKTHRVFSSTADLVWAPAVPGKKHLPSAAPGSFRLLVVSEK